MSNEPKPGSVMAWARLFRAYKLLLDQAETNLKRAKLPPLSWYDVLWEIHSAPDQRLRQFELGKKTLLPKYNLSRLLDRLQAEGLLLREICAEDKRGAVITLTGEGHRMLKRMWKSYGKTIRDRFEALLTEEEAEALAEILVKLIDSSVLPQA